MGHLVEFEDIVLRDFARFQHFEFANFPKIEFEKFQHCIGDFRMFCKQSFESWSSAFNVQCSRRSGENVKVRRKPSEVGQIGTFLQKYYLRDGSDK